MTSSISITIEPNVFDQDFDCRFSIKHLRLRFLQDFCPRLRLKSKVLDRNVDHCDRLISCKAFFAKCNYYGGNNFFKLQVICKASFRRENLCSQQIVCRKFSWEHHTSWLHFPKVLKHMKSKNKHSSRIPLCRIFIGDFCPFNYFPPIFSSIVRKCHDSLCISPVLLWVFVQIFKDYYSHAACLQD